jgi:AGCS family alanine or glycine:cation symporter
MWVIALIGGATAFVESTLAQLYKRRLGESFIGGPAYYILHGMHCRWMAVLFAILITLTFGLSYNSIQSNTICGALNHAFGFDKLIVGVILATVGTFIAFGGIRRVARVSSIVVPIMAIGYFILALVVVLMNIDKIPHVFRLIIDSAFGLDQFAGGALGITMMAGIKRGLFSNEAGEGSAPNVAATAQVTHPVKQGLVQALGVYTDTILVCSCTAFIILISGLYTDPSLNGIALTQSALKSEIGSTGTIFIAIAIFLFAFSSIIGNYYYGEANIRFLTDKPWAITVFRIFSGTVMVLFGAVASLEMVWNLGDVCMALLTACNLVAIAILGRYSFRLLKDYRSQKRAGIKDPVFHASTIPEVIPDLDTWTD